MTKKYVHISEIIIKLVDGLHHSQHLKWKWAGHVARAPGDRRVKRVTTWWDPGNHRNRGRPKETMYKKIAGNNWKRKEEYRKAWRLSEEIYTQKVTMTE
ncbi:hypothetical protein EVAR_103148_1 [Eumeta japonica]|uniref:Uncharacterized protein n=1 Tax=Eumeta variegata TaxID=151549 RepID=A0A4C1YGJ3_EUMVA|nr:hypothetical protein EVAR_103148_1 [Eumeta japonica]